MILEAKPGRLNKRHRLTPASTPRMLFCLFVFLKSLHGLSMMCVCVRVCVERECVCGGGGVLT